MMPPTTTLLMISSVMIARIGLKSMPPKLRQDAAEEAQERFADVAQEADHGVDGPRVGGAQAGGEEQLDHDVQR